MKIADLITHYTRIKGLHGPLSPSLASKLPHLLRVFGQLDAATPGHEIVAAARAEWGASSPGTLKRNLVQLRAIMAIAEDDGLIDDAPRIDMPYVNDTVVVDVTAAEVALLLQYVRWTEPRWYPLILVLAHTGARLSEALALGEGSYTRRGTRIERRLGRKVKTVSRTVPFTRLMQSEVESGVLSGSSKWRISLLPVGIAPNSASACAGRVLANSCEALGLPRLRVHDLRHSFASVMAEAGADIADIGAALGHSNLSMSMKYRGLVRGRLSSILSRV